MKTTVEKFSALADTLQNTVQVCASSKNKRELMTVLSSSIEHLDETVTYLKDAEKRKYIIARKSLSAILNVMSGMHDGLAEGDMTPKMLRKANAQIITTFLPKLAEGIASEEESTSEEDALRECPVEESVRSKIKISISSSNEMRQAISAVTVTSTGPTVGAEGGAEELQQLSQQARAALPIKIDGDFKVVRVPIVPVFPNIELTKTNVLKRLGLKHTVIAGFVILQDQILLNVSKKRSMEAYPQAKTATAAALALCHSVVELLNERGASKYEVVSDTPNANPRNTDLLMFWILPRPKMGEVMKIVGTSRKPGLLRWGLPLPSDRADTERKLIMTREAEHAKREKEAQEEIERLNAEREKREAERKKQKDAVRAEKADEQRNTATQKKEVATKIHLKSTPKPVAKPTSEKPTTLSPDAKSKLERLVTKNKVLHGKVQKPKHHR